MKNILFIFLIVLGFGSLSAADPKEDIIRYEAALKGSSPDVDQSNLMVKLARAHVRDQEVEKGIRLFLTTLDHVKTTEKTVTSEEANLYNEALLLYISSGDPLESAKLILGKYGKVAEEHPDYYLLNYLIAVSYANMGLFDRFFESYYLSYRHHPEEYLAYKAKAVLHSILHGKAKTEKEREVERAAVYTYAEKAQELYPHDSALYKIILSFSDEKKKIPVVRKIISTILEKNIVVPRADVIFYVRLAVESGEKGLAQQFIGQARKWYAYSRIVQEAEQLVGGEV